MDDFIQKTPGTNTPSAQDFDLLWARFEGDPAGRAVAIAKWCFAQAPHLADIVEARILAETPECPLRFMALARLALARGAAADPTWRPKNSQPSSQRVTRPAATQERLSESLEAFYARIYRVPVAIIDERQKHPVHALLEAQEGCLRVDPELGRLAIVLHQAAPFRLWLVGRELVRQTHPAGWVSRQDLRQALEQYGIKYTQRHIRRLLLEGEGVYWNCSAKRIYLRSWKHVAARLTELAGQQNVGDIIHNRPGKREQYVPVGGSLEQWEAALYAAWFSHRECPTIARETLMQLFGRDETTLRRWEQTHLEGVVQVRHNHAQCAEYAQFWNNIPAHAETYTAVTYFQKEVWLVERIRWQIANTYLVTGIRQHSRKGQSKKVRKRVNRAVGIPAEEKRGGWLRLYFDKPEQLHARLKRYRARTWDIPRLAFYVWRGEDHRQQGVFEFDDDGFVLTRAGEAAKPAQRRWARIARHVPLEV
ncbi:MAG: hypothetical protein KC519_14025 [Anaerolineae bacterium]|nr:hypothetical protein [Anaerolineae bacterium]